MIAAQTLRPPSVVPEIGTALDTATNSTWAEKVVEYAGRVCYASVPNMGKADNFIHDRIIEGHEDIVEHGWLTWETDFMSSDEELRLRRACRYVEVDRSDEGSTWVSGNLRVWRELIKAGKIGAGVAAAVVTVAPKVFVDLVPPDYTSTPVISYYFPRPSLSGDNVELLGFSYSPDIPFDNHLQATFVLKSVSRALTHQLVRHRAASFCLSEDTIVPSFRTGKGSGKQWTMKQLWDWQNDPQRSGRLRLMRLRGVNERGELIPVKIGQVIYSGKQQLWKVTTESGRVIRSTMKHRFLSPVRGWCRLEDLAVGEKILSNGVPAYKNEEYLRQRYLVENTGRKALAQELGVSDACLGVWIRKLGLQKPKAQYPGRHPGRGKKGAMTSEGREKLRRLHTGAASPQWKGDDVGVSGGRVRANKWYEAKECERCGGTVRVQRHHINGDPTNSAPENIAILCEPCHKAEHFGQVVMTVFPDRIVSIELDRVEDTYDLEIDDPCHNFVADGLVVHNSQESQRYVALEKGAWKPIIPPSIAADDRALATLQRFWRESELTYADLRRYDIRKEDARFILPNAAETKIVASMSFAYWKHFLWLRALDKAAQWEIRAVGQDILRWLYALAPGSFAKEMDYFVANESRLTS